MDDQPKPNGHDAESGVEVFTEAQAIHLLREAGVALMVGRIERRAQGGEAYLQALIAMSKLNGLINLLTSKGLLSVEEVMGAIITNHVQLARQLQAQMTRPVVPNRPTLITPES